MKRLLIVYFSLLGSLVLATKKNLIIDTDLFSDVDDAGALLLAATSPDVNLLAVNVNHPSSYSALAASAILAHYGKGDVPIGVTRPLTDDTFLDTWYFRLGEYASKVAYQFRGGKLRWGHAEEDAWGPVELYRKVLSEAADHSVTIVSIGFLDNLSALLNSTGDAHSPLPGRALLSRKVTELVVMGGAYPSGKRSWNFWGSPLSGPGAAAHVINSWGANTNTSDGDGTNTTTTTTTAAAATTTTSTTANTTVPQLTFLGNDVGVYSLAGERLAAEGPALDPVGMAYGWYGYERRARPAWDPLAVLYAVRGLEGQGKTGLFRVGDVCEVGCGFNVVDWEDGGNRWVCGGVVDGGGREGSRQECVGRNQRFLRLGVTDEEAAAEVDRLFLEGAWAAARGKLRVPGLVPSTPGTPVGPVTTMCYIQ
ncbi:inosine/uridine-preferring nucleoside hydrolase [Chaetomium fimeti]|uniref:Inosine/uridine-preferring nucleoside hydrolase n=1 Tax=Chaetomium fimeti TaxID=1854472 RepID=A0AAE0LQX8_9PEZI|nr:inosine/uridine-preferring nucleoside hydrolase [Chaetomium fimeti]